MKHKRATGVPDVGINASFFDEFERKLNLLGGNIINTGEFSFCNEKVLARYVYVPTYAK